MSGFGGSDDSESIFAKRPWYIKILIVNTAIFMFLVTVTMFADVLGRYLFNSSIKGGFEIIGFLLGILLFSAYPLITHDEEHITVGLLDGVVHGTIKKVRDICVVFASIVVIGFMSYRLWAEAEVLRIDEEIGEYLDFEIWPFSYILAGLALISALVLIRPLIDTCLRPVEIKTSDAGTTGDSIL